MNTKTPSSPQPSIEWDGKAFKASFPVGVLPKDVVEDKDFVLEFELEPALVYVVRYRELGGDQWSPGFITPFTNCEFKDLKPNTDYEMQVTAMNKHAEGEPSTIKFKTNAHGAMGNIVPFPRNRT